MTVIIGATHESLRFVHVRFLFTTDLKTASLKFLARRPKVKPEVLNMAGP